MVLPHVTLKLSKDRETGAARVSKSIEITGRTFEEVNREVVRYWAWLTNLDPIPEALTGDTK